jgi:hypothetical protein
VLERRVRNSDRVAWSRAMERGVQRIVPLLTCILLSWLIPTAFVIDAHFEAKGIDVIAHAINSVGNVALSAHRVLYPQKSSQISRS